MTIITNFSGFVNRGALSLAAFLFLPGMAFANYADVIFNEIAWMGTAASPNKEWIELYNSTDSTVALKGWRIVAADGVPDVALEKIIPGRGFYLLERTNDQTIPGVAMDQSYSGALENGGESLKIIDAMGNLIDEANGAGGWFAGDNSTKQTMERKAPTLSGSDRLSWQNSQNPGGTPREANSSGPPTETAVPPAAADQDKEAKVSAGLSLSEKTREIGETSHSPFWTFGLAFLIAALGGTALFVLRIVVNQNKS